MAVRVLRVGVVFHEVVPVGGVDASREVGMRGIHPAVYDADPGFGKSRERFLDGVGADERLSPEIVRTFAREESGRRGRLDRCRENYRETSWEGFRKLTLGRLRKELRREVGAVGNGDFVRVAEKFLHLG